jgi:hypothetical protein
VAGRNEPDAVAVSPVVRTECGPPLRRRDVPGRAACAVSAAGFSRAWEDRVEVGAARTRTASAPSQHRSAPSSTSGEPGPDGGSVSWGTAPPSGCQLGRGCRGEVSLQECEGDVAVRLEEDGLGAGPVGVRQRGGLVDGGDFGFDVVGSGGLRPAAGPRPTRGWSRWLPADRRGRRACAVGPVTCYLAKPSSAWANSQRSCACRCRPCRHTMSVGRPVPSDGCASHSKAVAGAPARRCGRLPGAH